MKMKTALTFLFCHFFAFVYSQAPIKDDSLFRLFNQPEQTRNIYTKEAAYVAYPIHLRAIPILPWEDNKQLNKDSVLNVLRRVSLMLDRNADSAILIASSLLLYSMQHNYATGIGYSYITLSGAVRQKGNYSKSLALLNRAKPYCELTARYGGRYGKQFIVMWYGQMGITYQYLGQYQKSFQYFLKAITISEKEDVDNNDLLISLNTNVGISYASYNEYDKAIEYLNKAQNQARQYDSAYNLASILNTKGIIYNEQNQLDSAYTAFMAALGYSIQKKNIPLQQAIYANLAALLLKKKNYQKAKFYVEKGLAVNKGEGLTIADVYLHFVSGQVYYFYLKDYRKAEASLLLALRLARKYKTTGYLDQFYNILAHVYFAQGNYKKAYKTMALSIKEYKKTSDKKQLESVNEMEAKYQTLKKDKEIAEQKLLLVTKDNKLKAKNLWITGISTGVLFLMVILFSFWINSKKKQKIKRLEAVMKGEENERSRIAKDLHDGVNQTIGAAKLNLMALEQEISFADDRQKQQLKKAIGLVDDSFIEIRQLSHNMMPRVLEEISLDTALRQLIADLGILPLEINLYTSAIDKHFNILTETFIYRLVQECVNNVIRHASATRLDISVIRDKGNVSLTIEDNGVGFDLNDETSKGIGLKNIEARVRLLKGKVEFDTAPGKGTLVAILIPVDTIAPEL